MPYPFILTIWKEAAHTHYLQWTETSSDRLLDAPKMKHVGNHPRELTCQLVNEAPEAAHNLLSASYAEWSGGATTGPVDRGMHIDYYTVQMDLTTGSYTTADLTFSGIVTEISQGEDMVLEIKAVDRSERLEQTKVSQTVFNSYRDLVSCAWILFDANEAGAKFAITLPETTHAYPLVQVLFATGDEVLSIHDAIPSPNTLRTIAEGEMMCQAFIAPTNGIYWFSAYYLSSAGWTFGNGHVQVRILRDTGSNRPNFNDEVCTLSMHLPVQAGQTEFDNQICDTSYEIVMLEEGEKYWWTIENHNSGEPAEDISIGYNAASTYLSDGDNAHYYHRSSGGSYTEYDGSLLLSMWLVNFGVISPENYHYELDSTTGRLVLDKSPGQWDAKVPQGVMSSPGNLWRGKLCYYYGTKTVKEIMEAVIPLEYGLFGSSSYYSVDSHLTATQHLFRTKGRSVGECMRELCDLFAYVDTDAWQTSFAHYSDTSNVDVIRVGKRKSTVLDAADYTIGEGTWISSVSARMQTLRRPSRIIVLGKTTANGMVTATVEDDDERIRAGIPVTETIQSDAAQTVDDAFTLALGALQAKPRNVWEGHMLLDGIFPQLMQEQDRDTGCGDGAILSVTYAPLGWSSLKLKVVAIEIGADYTDVQFTNLDLIDSNRFRQGLTRIERSESFTSPENADTVVYLPLYTDTGWAYDTYAQLCTAASTPIAKHRRVHGTYRDMVNPSRRVWHFEFDARNGYTASGTPVERIEFYDAYTGGSLIWTLDFSSAMSAAYEFHKWKTTRLVIDLVINPS